MTAPRYRLPLHVSSATRSPSRRAGATCAPLVPSREYRPPTERLIDALRECVQLDRELTVLESSGHVRLGAFARPLVTQPQVQQPVDDAQCGIHAAGYDDDACAEPFFQQFFDDDGRTLFEQLLRGRIRVLALAKLTHGRVSLAFVRAEVELAEAYGRANLWKQGHAHIATASELLTQLLLHLERTSPRFQAYIARLEHAAPEVALRLVRSHFACLDLSQDGAVPFHSFLIRLESVQHDNDGYLQALCVSLQVLLERLQHHSLTWPEVVELGSSRELFTRAVQELWPRQKLFLARLCLRRGKYEEAVRQAQLAIAQQEQLFGPESASLVPFYLVLAETLTLRYKQLGVVAEQAALDGAKQWLQSVEGSRALRAKAIEVIDDECARTGAVLPKKVAESRAADALAHTYSVSTLARPDPAMVDDAVEFCTKAWSIQESHLGRDHISVAAVHATLAQIYALKGEPLESIRYYTKAAEIYEIACSGTVPTSAFLRLEIAKLYQQPPLQELAKAHAAYKHVGEFFHSFAREFTGAAESTRRECCAHAIEAFRQCVLLLRTGGHARNDELRSVHEAIVRAASDGYGECSLEASESARELGSLLLDMGQLRAAEKHLRTASYIVESHFGPTDRRSRRLRNDVLDVAAKLRASTLNVGDGGNDDRDDDGHAWLTL